jgi:hypothetical protein
MSVVDAPIHVSGLISVSEQTPPITAPVDAEVDFAILKSLPKQFEINSEGAANWLVRKVIAAREYAEKVKVWAAQEQRRAEREEQTLMFLFGRQIENWTRDEIQKLKGRRKSISLPSGTIGLRTLAASLHVDDEQAVTAWAKVSCPSAVSTITIEKLSRVVLKEHFETTGEVPSSGAHVEAAKERFFIR